VFDIWREKPIVFDIQVYSEKIGVMLGKYLLKPEKICSLLGAGYPKRPMGHATYESSGYLGIPGRLNRYRKLRGGRGEPGGGGRA